MNNNDSYIFYIACSILGYVIVHFILKYKSTNANQSYDDKIHKNNESDLDKKRWHDILEVSENASIPEIQSAYRKKIAQYHPDKVVNLGKEIRDIALEKTKEINLAYHHAIKLKK